MNQYRSNTHTGHDRIAVFVLGVHQQPHDACQYFHHASSKDEVHQRFPHLSITGQRDEPLHGARMNAQIVDPKERHADGHCPKRMSQIRIWVHPTDRNKNIIRYKNYILRTNYVCLFFSSYGRVALIRMRSGKGAPCSDYL